MIELAFWAVSGVLLGFFFGLIEGVIVNNDTPQNGPDQNHNSFMLARLVVGIVFLLIVNNFITIPIREIVGIIAVLWGTWTPTHRLTLNITRGRKYPAIKWWHMGDEDSTSVYDKIWNVIADVIYGGWVWLWEKTEWIHKGRIHIYTKVFPDPIPFLAATFTELTIAVIAAQFI